MPLMAVLFICTNTIINLWIDERIETIQNIIAYTAPADSYMLSVISTERTAAALDKK